VTSRGGLGPVCWWESQPRPKRRAATPWRRALGWVWARPGTSEVPSGNAMPRWRSWCLTGEDGASRPLAAAGDAPRGTPGDPAGSHHLYLQLVVLLAVISIRHPRPPSAPVGSPLAGSPTQSDRTSKQAHHPNGMNTTVRIRRGHDAQEAKFLPARIPRMLIGSSQGASPPADPSVSASGEAGVSTESLS
jgi:hypothetical protein